MHSIKNRVAIKGLVLAGGRSSRMGTDKSQIIYHNEVQAIHVYNMLVALCDGVFISVNEHPPKAIQHLPTLKDRWPEIGPLGGIGTAFSQDANCAWLVVACDMPLLTLDTLKRLILSRNPSKIATCFTNEHNQAEPLLCIYEPSAWSFIKLAIEQGRYSPASILVASKTEFLPSPGASQLINVNTTEDAKSLPEFIKKKSLN